MENEREVSGPSSAIVPQALPKGMEKFCELCDGVAHLRCAACLVTAYCNAEHQQADWVGIHKRICPLLLALHAELSFSQSELKLKKMELIEICKSEAQSRLSQGKHHEALPAAHSCLRCSRDTHGAGALQLVSPYLLLAEANMGLGNLPLAKEFLSQAQWVVSKNPQCANEILHRLHRSLGRLHVVTGNLEAARFNFANDIYYASEEYDLESTVIATGYFLLAGVFAQEGKTPIACSLYSEVAHQWHSHLDKLLQTHIQGHNTLSDSEHDKAQRVEMEGMLRTMLEFVQKHTKRDWAQTALVAHCLAILWFLEGDSSKAAGFGSTALRASQLIPDHDLAQSIQGLLQLLHSPAADESARSP